MNCMKCGRKTEGTNVFCAACLAGMEQYPIKPGAVVHIPVRQDTAERKQLRVKKERTPEEQITVLHKLVQILVVCVAALATTLMVSLGVLGYVLAEDVVPEETRPTPMRRNYSTTAPANVD